MSYKCSPGSQKISCFSVRNDSVYSQSPLKCLNVVKKTCPGVQLCVVWFVLSPSKVHVLKSKLFCPRESRSAGVASDV